MAAIYTKPYVNQASIINMMRAREVLTTKILEQAHYADLENGRRSYRFPMRTDDAQGNALELIKELEFNDLVIVSQKEFAKLTRDASAS